MKTERIERTDKLRQIKESLENLVGTMAVIYEGLFTGEMEEESPHCILVLQQTTENIHKMVEELEIMDT